MHKSRSFNARRAHRRRNGWEASALNLAGQWWKVGVAVLVVAVVGVAIWKWQGRVEAEPVLPAFVPKTIEEKWQAIALDYTGMSVAAEVWDMSTQTRASFNGLELFRAASVTKLITAGLLLDRVESGHWDLDQRLTDGVTSQWHLEQMIRYSNNDSWRKMRDALDRTEEQAYANKLGLTSYSVTNNVISASDVAMFLRQLEEGKLVSATNYNVLLSYMTDTYEERFVPQFVPEGAIAFHKTGSLDGDIHDAAIIDYKGRRYVLVIMTSGQSTNYDVRMELYNELVSAVFDNLTLDKPAQEK